MDINKLAREAGLYINNGIGDEEYVGTLEDIERFAALVREDEREKQQEPVVWQPIGTLKPTSDELDILMGDGSILCKVLTQSDGDLWWDGSGTGEKFIDPEYADVTHWRKHSDTTPPTCASLAALAARQMRDAAVKVCNEAIDEPSESVWNAAVRYVLKRVLALPVPDVQWRDLTPQEVTEQIREGAADGGWQGFAERVIAKFKEKQL